MEIENNQQNPNNDEGNSKENSSLETETKKQTDTPDSPANNPNNKVKPEKLYFGIFRMADLIQLGTLIAFIWVSGEAIKQTNIALDYTKRSLGLTEISILSSDSTTREALRISDSSLIVASKDFQTREKFAKLELRAYLEIGKVYFDTISFGKRVIVAMQIKNTGKTPAYDVVVKVAAGHNIEIDFAKGLEMAEKGKPQKFLIGAGETQKANLNVSYLSRQDSIEIMGEVTKFVIIGYIEYRDVFGENQAFQFCHVYVPPPANYFINCGENYETKQKPN